MLQKAMFKFNLHKFMEGRTPICQLTFQKFSNGQIRATVV